MEKTTQNKTSSGRGRKKGTPKVSGSGRKKGTPNKATTEFRQFFAQLLDGEVQSGKIQHALENLAIENPDKYLAHIEKITPFVLPTLQSVEFEGKTEVTDPFIEHMLQVAQLSKKDKQ